MDFEKFLIFLLLFGFVCALFPTLVTAIAGIDPGEPLKWLFNFIPYAFLGGFIFIVALWGLRRD